MDDATQAAIDARFLEIVRPLAMRRRRCGYGQIALAAAVLMVTLAGMYALHAFVVRGLSSL